jgi:chemotaxis protein CheD
MKFCYSGKRITIQPGGYQVSSGEVMLSTLLGSCVAACLYDAQRAIIGMNHFLLARKQNYSAGDSMLMSNAGRYGVHAMELLINGMLKLGAQRDNLRAKVFGGGNVLPGVPREDCFFNIGDINSRFVVDFLRNENIPIVSQGLGGVQGRVIHFVSTDYAVYVKTIPQGVATQLVKAEEQYWEHKIHQRKDEDKFNTIEFF